MKKIMNLITKYKWFAILILIVLVLLLLSFTEKSLKKLNIKNVKVYSVNFEEEEYLGIESDYKKILESKELVESNIENDEMSKLKKIILNGEKRVWDYTSTSVLIPEYNAPNYVLELEDNKDNIMYMFMWLYDEEDVSFVQYFNSYNLKEVNSNNFKDVAISEDDTKTLKEIILDITDDNESSEENEENE